MTINQIAKPKTLEEAKTVLESLISMETRMTAYFERDFGLDSSATVAQRARLSELRTVYTILGFDGEEQK